MFKIKKNKYKTKVSFCGLTLYKKVTDKKEEFTKLFFLLNSIYYKHDIFMDTFNFRVFGLNVLRTKLFSSYKWYYLLFIPIWVKKVDKVFRNRFFNNILQKYPDYNDYYIFPCRSGEFFLLMHHFQEWVEKNKSVKPLLVFTAKYHLNICKIFYPNYDMCYIKKVNVPLVSRGIDSTYLKYKNKNFYIPMNEKYFVEVENAIRNKNAHYYDCLKSHLGLTEKIHNYSISSKTEDKAYKIAKYILNDNFVIISPETLSNEPMEKDFWDNLCKELKNIGYEVFCNSMDFSNLVQNSTSTFLTYEEAIALAKYAKAIIGMRSGFLECLSQNNVPLFVLYTDFSKRPGFKKISSDKVLSGFSIKKLPNVKPENIYEYDVNLYKKEKDITENIIKHLENKGIL